MVSRIQDRQGQSIGRGIKDVFYETRAAMGRGYSVRRFAQEVLGGTVEPINLACIERGTRFPTEALVRRLATIRKENPQQLLALLWRDRILHGFGRELRRVLEAPSGLGGIEDADLAVLVSHAISALPPDKMWMPLAAWRKSLRHQPSGPGQAGTVRRDQVQRVEAVLLERELVEIRAGKIRSTKTHYVAQGGDERWSLSIEFCALFVKGLLDKLALADVPTATYLRNHYLHIEPDKLEEFQRQLDTAVGALVNQFAADATSRNPFLNVLITSTVP